MQQGLLKAHQFGFAAGRSDRRETDRGQTLRAVLPSLQRRPVWLNARYLALTWGALLAYGTLIPFDFDLAGRGARFWDLWSLAAAALTSVTWRPATGGGHAWTVDLATNLLLYGPLGLFVRLGAHRHRWRWGSQIAITATVLVLVSYLLECTQSLTPSRVGSWYDVAMNTTGGMLFAFAAVRANTAVRLAAFWVYRNSAFGLRQALGFMRQLRCRRWITYTLVAIDVALVTVLGGTALAADTPPNGGVNWLPFLYQFHLSYDIAMTQIGSQMIHYGFLAILLSIHLLIMPLRHRIVWLILAVMLLTVLPMPWRSTGAVWFGGDITESIIALLAVSFLVTGAHVLAHAVRRCDRRRRRVPIDLDLRRL